MTCGGDIQGTRRAGKVASVFIPRALGQHPAMAAHLTHPSLQTCMPVTGSPVSQPPTPDCLIARGSVSVLLKCLVSVSGTCISAPSLACGAYISVDKVSNTGHMALGKPQGTRPLWGHLYSRALAIGVGFLSETWKHNSQGTGGYDSRVFTNSVTQRGLSSKWSV
jgi:hypothetical protein